MRTSPNFINSPYFVGEPGNWHLKDDAPQEVVDEFNEWMKAGELKRNEIRLSEKDLADISSEIKRMKNQ